MKQKIYLLKNTEFNTNSHAERLVEVTGNEFYHYINAAGSEKKYFVHILRLPKLLLKFLLLIITAGRKNTTGCITRQNCLKKYQRYPGIILMQRLNLIQRSFQRNPF